MENITMIFPTTPNIATEANTYPRNEDVPSVITKNTLVAVCETGSDSQD